MRFPKFFKRYIGGTGPQLGGDEVPVGAPRTNLDNQLAMRLSNTNGYPVQRIVIGYSGPDGAPDLPAFVYVYDDHSEKWYSVEPASRMLSAGSLTYFDLPTLADNPNVGSRDVGAIELCAIVGMSDDADELPEGEYGFVVGGDVSNAA